MSKINFFQVGLETYFWLKQNNFEAHWKEVVESTQAWAKEELDFSSEIFESLVPSENNDFRQNVKFYICDFQTHGRGQGNHLWTSPPMGSSLMFTMTLPLLTVPEPKLTLLLGQKIYESLKQTWPSLSWRVKEPNDIYVNENKITGMLTETISQGNKHFLVFGMGLNIFNGPDKNQVPYSTYLKRELEIQNHPEVNLTLYEWQNFLNHLVQKLAPLTVYEEPMVLPRDSF